MVSQLSVIVLSGLTFLSPGIVIVHSDDGDEQAELRQVIAELGRSEDATTAVKELIRIDEFFGKEAPAGGPDSAGPSILIALAKHGTPTAMEHVRAAFETQPHRRHHAALAISVAALRSPVSDQDWRFMVRALPIVKGDAAVSVMKALSRYRRRATKPSWIRECILTALEFSDEQLPAAIDLLKLWTSRPPAGNSPAQQLAGYQSWFVQTYPGEPAPSLPTDRADAKWKYADTQKLLTGLPTDEETLLAGRRVFFKAGCAKCHRRDGIDDQPADDRLGPNLTSLGWRRQPQQILTAVLYPSHRLNDEYPNTTVLLASGRTLTGLLMPSPDGELQVTDGDLKTTTFRKGDVEDMTTPAVSSMPAGLLEPLTADEVRQLFALLVHTTGEYDPHRE